MSWSWIEILMRKRSLECTEPVDPLPLNRKWKFHPHRKMWYRLGSIELFDRVQSKSIEWLVFDWPNQSNHYRIYIFLLDWIRLDSITLNYSIDSINSITSIMMIRSVETPYFRPTFSRLATTTNRSWSSNNWSRSKINRSWTNINRSWSNINRSWSNINRSWSNNNRIQSNLNFSQLRLLFDWPN